LYFSVVKSFKNKFIKFLNVYYLKILYVKKMLKRKVLLKLFIEMNMFFNLNIECKMQ